MKFKTDWEMTKKRFVAWWNRSKMGRPAMRIIAKLNEPLEPLELEDPFPSPMDFHLDVERRARNLRNFCRTHRFLAEAYPSLDINIGPLAVATYLGSEPVFAWDTVWYNPCANSGWGKWAPRYDVDNPWWKLHQERIRQAKMIAGDDFLVNIPDMGESLDLLSVLRGPQELVYDLVDDGERIVEFLQMMDPLYFTFYDQMYNLVKDAAGGSSYTTFEIWGPGRVAKVQCDFSALMSPRQFRELFLPSLQYQCARLDYSLYHLDGPDAIKHLPAVLEVRELDALQWTSGAGKPDGGSEDWYPIYDMVKKAGKSLWVQITDGYFDEWVEKADNLVKRYGADGLYILFPIMEFEEARELLQKAEKDWK